MYTAERNYKLAAFIRYRPIVSAINLSRSMIWGIDAKFHENGALYRTRSLTDKGKYQLLAGVFQKISFTLSLMPKLSILVAVEEISFFYCITPLINIEV